MSYLQICLNLPLDDDEKVASEVMRLVMVIMVIMVILVIMAIVMIVIMTIMKMIFGGYEAEDDDHGLALHLPHLEHLHLPQGQFIQKTLYICLKVRP